MSTSTNRRNYSKGQNAQQMQEAITEFHRSPLRPIREISSQFQVDRKALSCRLQGTIRVTSGPGRPSYLDAEDEKKLVKFLIEVASLGFGYSLSQVRYLVSYLLNREAGLVTTGWHYGFMKRYPELVVRRTEALDRLRARAVNQTTIEQYFDVLNEGFKKCRELSKGEELTPDRIFSMDETGISPNQRQKFVVCKRGERSVFSICSENREHLTIIGAASAGGWSARPAFILPKKIDSFLGDSFPGSLVEVTSTGYINDSVYVKWCKSFVENIKCIRGDNSLWCLLILDGHTCHTMNPEALRVLNNANILTVSLASHTTAILQVHDVSIFGPFKKFVSSAIAKYIMYKGPNILLKDLPSIIEDPWEKANSNYNIKSGFRKVGIWPLNLNWPQNFSQNSAILKIKTNLERFNQLRVKAQLHYTLSELLLSVDYLDVCQNLVAQNLILRGNADSNIDKTLSLIIYKFKEHHYNLEKPKTKPRLNMIKELCSTAKILNESERIESIAEEKVRREEKKLEKEERKRERLRKKAAKNSEDDGANDDKDDRFSCYSSSEESLVSSCEGKEKDEEPPKRVRVIVSKKKHRKKRKNPPQDVYDNSVRDDNKESFNCIAMRTRKRLKENEN